MRESGSERMTETHGGQNTMQETERVMKNLGHSLNSQVESMKQKQLSN